MKGIAIILAGCMLFLNVGSLLGNFQSPVVTAEIECCSDCCSACRDSGSGDHDDKDSCDTGQDCLPDCDCSYQYQIAAIAYSYTELTGVVVQSFHYGHYMDSYTFEYIDYFLQPPRFG